MAFVTNAVTTPATRTTATTSSDSWKAQGFINCWLPKKSGVGRTKLGTLPLKESLDSQKKLLTWLNEDATRVNNLKPKMIIELQAVDAEGSDDAFDLPMDSVVVPITTSKTTVVDKAQGFLNFSLMTKDGGFKKLGSIPLRDKNVNEARLLAWLNQDATRVSIILEKLELDYRPATTGKTSGSDFDLS